MRAITTVSAIVFLVTPDTRVATAYILNRVEDGEYGVAIAYGSILIVVMLAIIFIFDWLIGESRTSRSKAKTVRNGAHYDSENFVELRNVTKRFGSNTVIDNINLTIPQGQMVTLLGPSGCGKTTILRLVAGLEKPVKARFLLMAKTSPIVPFSNATSAWCFSRMLCFRTCRWERTSAMA